MAVVKASPSTRSILVELNNGSRLLVEDIPPGAKCTYGKVQPGDRSSFEHALRIYTAANNQLAVFTGVASFRDLSITVKHQRTRRILKSDASVGPNGTYGDESYETTASWEEVAIDATEPPWGPAAHARHLVGQMNQFVR